MQLVIVESPTKAKTIGRFLGADFVVRSSYGHVRDLPKSKLSIDVAHNFEPKYAIIPKAKEVLRELQGFADKADTIILATDEDREGEAIAWHLAFALGLDETAPKKKGKKASEPKDVKRIVFHEITKSAIHHALENPRTIDQNLVDAQQARRILDRLVGYELSPFLWRKIRYGLSAGRVQSVAVRLVVDRERAIQNFKQEEYWSIEADLSPSDSKEQFRAKLTKIDGKAVDKMEITNTSSAQTIVQQLDKAHYRVGTIEKKEAHRNPSAPFTTSTLQQEASRKFGMSAKQTMVIAQQLYEGIDIGDTHPIGLITYMRTDSLNLALSALEQAKQAIMEHFGKDYVLEAPRHYTNKSKGAQEAHEAIRPTNLLLAPQSVKQYLDAGQFKLYDLIWKRTVASQMQPAIFDQTSIDIDAKASKDFTFRATGQVIKFDGFIKAYTEGRDDDTDEDAEGRLPQLAVNVSLNLLDLVPLQHFTEPPARFTDASLIKILEAHGVGRPSTYAPTLTTIQDRGYVDKLDKKYQPTEIGFLVNDMLVENFPEIVDIDFTSHVEEQLDEIAEGHIKWVPVIEEFYTPFKKHLIEKEASVEKLTETSTTPCPHCGKMMMIKFGRMGKFLACPEEGSKVTLPMPEEAAQIAALEEKTKDERCPLCGKVMAVKRGRFGYFLGCSDYPTCKGIAKIVTRIGFKCPHCSIGDMLEKKSRGRGKPFYACSRYPDCTFAISTRPTTEVELKELFENWKANPPKPRKPYAKKKKVSDKE